MNFLLIILVIISIAFIVWIVSSFVEFKKMEENPNDFKERRSFKSVSDGSEEL